MPTIRLFATRATGKVGVPPWMGLRAFTRTKHSVQNHHQRRAYEKSYVFHALVLHLNIIDFPGNVTRTAIKRQDYQ